jgi:hypothetical protein
MKITDIKLIDTKVLNNPTAVEIYNKLKKKTEDFNEGYLELYEEEVMEFVNLIKKKRPEAFVLTPDKKTPQPRTPKTPTPRAPKTPRTPRTPREEGGDDIVEQVMHDYALTREKAIRLIALRNEAIELKKDNLDKLLDRLDKSEFYEGRNRVSRSPIDKGRTRDLGKDSNQGALTSAEERKMTGTPFKRISKAGAKNQYGTTEGNKVYYEYRQNRRDVDNKIKLATGGVLGQDVTYRYYDEQRTGNIISELPNGYEVSTEYGTVLVTPKEVISINAPKKKRFSFFKDGGGVGIPNADKMFHLPYEIAVYVPSTKDVDKTITATELRARVKEVEKYLAETFGGFTSSEKVGGYLSSKSAIVTEKVVPVTTFSSLNDFTVNKSKLINKMSVWAKKWGQEAIGFEFEGDLYYVPQKFKTGGTLKATYIPRRDIKMLTTVWGNNIKGKDLIDGAYTKRKNIKSSPKVARTQFEDETFEYKKGGNINLRGGIPKSGSTKLFDLQYGDVFQITVKNHTQTGAYFLFIDLSDDYNNVSLKVRTFPSLKEREQYITGVQDGDIRILSRSDAGEILMNYSVNNNVFKMGGSLKATYIPRRDIKSLETVYGNNISGKDLYDGAYTKRKNIKSSPKVARTQFEDETFEYAKGGRLDLFEDYENIPTNVQKVLDKYAKKFGDDFSGMSYQDMKKMHDEIYKLGYTFDSGLDNQAFGLRPIGLNLNELVGYEDEENDNTEYAKGGLVAYANDDYETRIATFNNLAEAKKFAKANKWKYESILFEDDKLDNIVVNKGDTFKDIDFLFSN